MENFLKINKALFKQGLNPTQILIVAQVMEFERTTGDCFISNDKLAEDFGVSVSTIKRDIAKLEEMDILVRNTKSVQKGKERHMSINYTRLKMNLPEKSTKLKMNLPESSNCTLRKEQNEPIKEKVKDNNKIKVGVTDSALRLESVTNAEPEVEEVKVDEAAAPNYPTIRKRNLANCPVEIIWLSEDLIQIPNNDNKIFKVIL